MKVYALECRTGCTCCSDENHFRGFYKTREEAEARKTRFYKGIDNPLASQYAKYGAYYLKEYEAEEIADNRIIVNNRVFPKVFIEVDAEGATLVDDYLTGDYL